jgi:hypothetical protein
MEDGRSRIEDRRSKIEDGRWRMEDGRIVGGKYGRVKKFP